MPTRSNEELTEMKTMLKKLRKMWLGGALLGLAACNEPYQQPLNPNAQPAVVLADFRDAVSYNGDGTLPGAAGSAFNLEVGTSDAVNSPDAATPDETGFTGSVYGSVIVAGTEANPPASITLAPTQPVTPGNGNGVPGVSTVARDALIYPFMAPRIEFNKLMNGDTIEKTVADPATGRQLGQCVMQPGALTLSYTGPEGNGTEPSVLACYSPSDLLITTTAALPPTDDGTPNPKDFLQYSANYTLTTGTTIKDKQNKTLTPFTLKFTTSPFELLFVNDLASGTTAWASPDSGFGIDGTDPTNLIDDTSADPQVLQLIFTGSVIPTDTVLNTDVLNGVGTPPAPPVVFVVDDTNDTETALSQGGVAPFFGVEIPAFETSPDSTDPRILLLYHPNFVVSQGQDPGGFAAGHYRVHLPLTFTDNGTVTGTPVSIACPDGTGGSSGTTATCSDVTFDFYVGPVPASR
jgi:hypothetical protein